MSQQVLRQASVRAVTLTANPYEGDWHALFDLAAIPQGPFNGRLLSWINLKLSKAFTNLPEAQQALAEANGAVNFSSMASSITYTEGDGFTATPITYRGASNVSGNQDGTGVTVGTEVQARVANPGNIHNEGGSGASNSETLARYNASAAPLKTSDQILQLFGLNDASTNPRDRMVNVRDFVAAFGSNGVGQWALMSSLNVAGQYGEKWGARRQIDLMIRDAYGPKAMSLGTIQLDPALFPRADALNDGDASQGIVPRQYKFDTSHMNAAGYIKQADAVWWPITRAFSGVLPCLVYPEVLSTEPTANTAGGFVADVGVLGDLAGCTVELLSHQASFAIAVQATGVGTSKIRVTRNAGGVITAAYSDLQVRITKGTVRDVYTLRLGIAALDDNCHEVAFTSLGQNNTGNSAGAHYAMFERSSGLDPDFTTNTKYSAFIKFRPLEGAIGLGYALTDAGGNGVFTVGVTTGGGLSSRSRNGSNTTSVYTHANTTGIKADSTDWELCCFVCVDTAAGVAYFRYERISYSAPGVVAFVEPVNSGAMPLNSPLGLALPTQRCIATGGTGVPMVHGCQWEAADFMDFRQEANRALFRNATTLALQNNYERANFDRVMSVAGVGSGSYVTPHVSIRGNAAERVLGSPNRGNGTTTAVDPDDTGRLCTAFSGCTITTVT